MLEELYDKPEDTSTQTVIQNRYTFWCHKRGKQTAVSSSCGVKMTPPFSPFLLLFSLDVSCVCVCVCACACVLGPSRPIMKKP
jgi:hypothetical protein